MSEQYRPIRPSEVAGFKSVAVPPEVFDELNKLIAKHAVGDKRLSAKVTVREFCDAVSTRLSVDRPLVFANGWANIEACYREAGWIVKYDSPAWDECFDSYWEFKSQ